jgi:hypothetical protein
MRRRQRDSHISLTALASILMPWKWLFLQITVAVLISWPGQAAGGTA